MGEQTSIWKKELSLRRRGPAPAPLTAKAPAAQPTSIWKKELSLRPRRSDRQLELPMRPAAKDDEKASPWKRQIRFRKLSPAPVRPTAAAAETAVRKESWQPPKHEPWSTPPAPEIAAPPAPGAEAPVTRAPAAEISSTTAPREAAAVSATSTVPPLPPVARPLAGLAFAPGIATNGVAERPPAPEPPPAGGAAPADPEPEPPTATERAPAPEPPPMSAGGPTDPEPEPVPKASKERRSRSRRGQGAGLVGLRIGSSQIVAALVHNAPGPPELVQLARKQLQRGVVVAGEVREPDALAAALREFFAEHKLPRRAVRLGIASNRIGVRTLEVPAIPDPRLLENAIRFRAQELLSIPVTEAVLDHVRLGEVATAEGPGQRVLLAFAHRELIDRYVEACRRARLKLAGIDFDAFALLRAVADPPVPDTTPDRATVAVAIGHERTIFAVAEGELCDYTRVLDWGGASLTVGLARALNLAPSQAEPIKQGLAFDRDLPGCELSAVQAEAGRAAMRSELQALARELLASLQFYQSRPGSLAIGEILLTGGAAQLPGLDAELERVIGVPVRTVDPYRRVRLGRRARPFAEPGAAAIAIGLGMEG